MICESDHGVSSGLPPEQEGSFEKIVKALDGPTLVRKGTVDTISDGETTLVCNEPGSNRRAGGQVTQTPDSAMCCVQHLRADEGVCVALW